MVPCSATRWARPALLLGLSGWRTTRCSRPSAWSITSWSIIVVHAAPAPVARWIRARPDAHGLLRAVRNRLRRDLALGRDLLLRRDSGWSGRSRCRTASAPVAALFVVTARPCSIGARLVADPAARRARPRDPPREALADATRASRARLRLLSGRCAHVVLTVADLAADLLGAAAALGLRHPRTGSPAPLWAATSSARSSPSL